MTVYKPLRARPVTDGLMSLGEVAALARRSHSAVIEWVDKGKLPCRRPPVAGSHRRFHPDHVTGFLLDQPYVGLWAVSCVGERLRPAATYEAARRWVAARNCRIPHSAHVTDWRGASEDHAHALRFLTRQGIR